MRRWRHRLDLGVFAIRLRSALAAALPDSPWLCRAVARAGVPLL